MDTTRRISDLAPEEVPIVERMFGQHLDRSSDAVLILRVSDSTPLLPEGEDLPDWCNVLKGMSDEDVDDFNEILKTPVQFRQRET